MENEQKLQVRFGDAEFSAEGEGSLVNAQYDRFLAALAARPANTATSAAVTAAIHSPERAPGGAQQVAGSLASEPGDLGISALEGSELSAALLDRAYRREKDGVVSLLVMPKETADAILLTIYGFTRLGSEATVTTVLLMKGLKQGGISIPRIDRALGDLEGQFITKVGRKRGTRYGLTNRGARRAESIIKDLLS